MVIVSFKTNKQFYDAPAVMTQPMHPENWSEAWRLVTPTVANTSNTAVTWTVNPASGAGT